MSSPTAVPTDEQSALPDGSKWRVVPAESQARFSAKTLWGLSSVTGDLGQVGGELDLEGGSGRGRLWITVRGLSSGNPVRDRHLRSRAFFAVSNHPDLTFEVSSVEQDGATLHLAGELVVRNQRHPFATAATVTPLADGRIALTATEGADLEKLGMSRGFAKMIPPAVSADVRAVLERVEG